MYKAFKMDLSDFSQSDIKDFYSLGQESFSSQKQYVRNSLDKYLSPEGVLQISEVEKDWFPSIKADVFLSHSHKDEKKIIAFAGYLSYIGISAFIDSCVWGYANNLLKQLDNAYCVQYNKPNGGHIYDYDKRNESTAVIHTLLNGALLKMIDSTECLMFIDTPNSIRMKDVSNGVTNSGWIYSELLMSKYICPKVPNRLRHNCRFDESYSAFNLLVDYDVDITHLINLSFDDILKAQNGDRCKGTDILDRLYLKQKS